MGEAFFRCVRAGDIEGCADIVARDPAVVRATDRACFGLTAAGHAARAGDGRMLRWLVERGADLNQRSLWWAGSWGVDDELPEALVPEFEAMGLRLGVHALARLGWVERLGAMLDEDRMLVHMAGGDGARALHFAKDPATVDLLLSRGADLEARCVDHESTPAQWAAAERPKAARRMIERGAATDPLMLAAVGDVERLSAWMDEHPQDISVRVDDARFTTRGPTTALHIYAYTLGARVGVVHVAARNGNGDAVRALVRCGADPDARGAYDDGTPLHLAAWGGRTSAITALLDCGASIDAESGPAHRNTPLGWAVVAGRVEAARVLLERGAAVRGYYLEDARRGEAGGFRDFAKGDPEGYRAIAALLVAAG